MKVLVSTLFFLVNLFVVFSQNSTTKICNVSSINDLLNSSKNDSIQKIERLAALKFHILINNYRLKNGLDTIGWDEGLWLTCRNHNVWMASNSDLTHKQLKNTKFFIGEENGANQRGGVVFASGVTGDFESSHKWPIGLIAQILKLADGADAEMKFSVKGAIQININTGLVEYKFVFPAKMR